MPHQFKVWDKEKNRMVGQQWMLPNPDDRFEVLILSGAVDKNDMPIGHKDIVTYGKNKYLVRYNGSKLRWIIIPYDVRDTTIWEEPLNSEMAKNMEIVSNLLQEEANHERETGNTV
jgi:hypothetical protein